MKIDKQDRLAQDVLKKIQEVIDPEIGISVVDLGLIYDVNVNDGSAWILMTLTFPGCPLANLITSQVREKVQELEDIKQVEVELTFTPPWNKEMVSDKMKKQLGLS
ncbi:MAG: metal-sulfur cluster assembly factor [Patescibacteria group bacterium]|jgi:metal-sulfur cluster biosynthetic enzyme